MYTLISDVGHPNRQDKYGTKGFRLTCSGKLHNGQEGENSFHNMCVLFVCNCVCVRICAIENDIYRTTKIAAASSSSSSSSSSSVQM